MHYWRPFSGVISLSAAAMLLASLLSMAIQLSAKDIISYGEGMTSQGTSQAGEGSPLPSFPDGSSALVRDASAVAGVASERFYGVLTSAVAKSIWGSVLSPFSHGLLCRCLLMGTLIVLYHQVSLFAHLAAYKSGLASQTYLVQDSLQRIVSTHHPERIAVVSSTKISHILMNCGKTVSDTLGALLTNMLPSLLSAAIILIILLYISFTLTVCIGLIVGIVQYVYHFVCRHHSIRDAQLAAQEAMIHDTLANIIQRSETIFVAKCEEFVLAKLQAILLDLTRLRVNFDRAIHGYSAVFSTAITLVFVAMLGVLKQLNFRGDLVLMDIALYFIFLYQFVERIQSLSADFGRLRSGLGRLHTLQQTLRWFDEPVVGGKAGCRVIPAGDRDGGVGESGKAARRVGMRGGSHPNPNARATVEAASRTSIPPNTSANSSTNAPMKSAKTSVMTPGGAVGPSFAGPLVVLHDDAHADLELRRVSYVYGVAPAFLGVEPPPSAGEGGGFPRGIRDLSLRAAAGRITSLYGPSGCGKSTCLRLLSGFLRPQRGVVHTRRRALLLEQHPAVFLGSVAENVVLRDLRGVPTAREGDDRKGAKTKSKPPPSSSSSKSETFAWIEKKLNLAMREAGCEDFVADPFHTRIENVNQPPFSGGQLQRICLARVFAQTRSCSLVLLDEPTTGLDGDTVEKLLITIKELRDVHKKTVLISTHDQRVASISDAVIHLS
ncbi:unnamed protein product [Phytomonas sp. EM1]|nr:unnamed protein product [Phytomonas sp. EM1]|eukprot:CCW62852.1 unnamed protein product [Phytomonas sp. isolate EM1]